MKRSMTRLGFAALAFSLAACGSGNPPADTADAAPAPTPAPQAETPAPATEEVQATNTASAETPPAPAPQAAETVTASAFAGFPEPYATADYDRGKRTFKLCMSCHVIQEGGPNRVGPNLYGLFGREIGTVEGFAYSDAVLAADFTWTPAKLEEWLADPRGFLPGNRMSFAGVRRPEDRHAVIAYIMSESGYAGETE